MAGRRVCGRECRATFARASDGDIERAKGDESAQQAGDLCKWRVGKARSVLGGRRKPERHPTTAVALGAV